MSEFLKGNYKSPELKIPGKAACEEKSTFDEFEARALEKLGGSIAFMMKSKNFLWTPDADSKPQPEQDQKPPK